MPTLEGYKTHTFDCLIVAIILIDYKNIHSLYTNADPTLIHQYLGLNAISPIINHRVSIHTPECRIAGECKSGCDLYLI